MSAVFRRRAAIALFLALTAASCREPAPPRNVLLVTLDTFRADRIGAATPALAGLARDGRSFEAADSPCSAHPARARVVAVRTLAVAPRPSQQRRRHVPIEPRHARRRRSRAPVIAPARSSARSSSIIASVSIAASNATTTRSCAMRATAAARSRRSAAEARSSTARWPGCGRATHDRSSPGSTCTMRTRRTRRRRPIRKRTTARSRTSMRRWRGCWRPSIGATTIIVVVGDHGESLGEHGELTHGLLLVRADASRSDDRVVARRFRRARFARR